MITRLEDNLIVKRLLITMFVILNIPSLFVTIHPLYELLKSSIVNTYFYVIIILGISFYLSYKYRITMKVRNLIIFCFITCVYLISNYIISFSGTFENSMDVLNILLYLFVFFVLLSESVIDKSGLSIFAHLLVYFAFYACVYNIIINFDVITKVFTTISAFGGYEYKLCSFFPARNNFGAFLATAIASYNLFGKDKMKIYNLIILGILLFNLFLTFSRTAILATIVCYLVYYYLVSKNKFKYTIIVLIVLVASFITFKYIDLLDLINNLVIRTNYYDSGRFLTWKSGLEIFFNNNILLGSGFNGAITKMGIEYHNGYIFLLASSGLLIFIPFIILMCYVFIISIRIQKYDLVIGSAFISFICIYMINSMTEVFVIFNSGIINLIYTILVVLFPLYYWNGIKSQKS